MRDAGVRASMFGPTLVLMSGRILAFVATFLTPVVLARVFTPTEFGTYKQLFLVFATLYYIAQVGMAESLFYFLPAAGAAAGRYTANAVLFLAAAGVACGALLEATRGAIARSLHNDALAAHLPWIAAFLGLMLMSAAVEVVMTARGRYVSASVCYGASDLLRAVCLIVPALLLGRLDAVLLGAVAFALVRAAAGLACVARTFGATFRLDRARLGQQLAYAGPFGLAVLLEVVQGSLHQYVVSYRFDAATFAVYAVGCLQIPLVDLVATSAGNVLMVQTAEAVRGRRTERVLSIWHDATRKLALVFFPLVAVLVVTARDLVVVLFTERYRASVPVFVVSTAAIVLATLATDAVLRVYGETGFLLRLNALRLAAIVVLIGPLVAVLRLPGAMLAVVVTTAGAKGLALLRIRRLMGVGLARLLPWARLAATAAAASLAALAGLAARAAVGGSPLPSLVAASATAVAVYGTLLLPLLDEDERAALNRWRHRRDVGARAAARSRP